MEKLNLFTTLAYIEKGDSYLLLYRNKKNNDFNKGKYVGIGGKIEKGESIVACMKREIKEETNLDVLKYKYLGKIDFINPSCANERMYLFKVFNVKGDLTECNEGSLEYIKKSDMNKIPVWEGDKLFIPLLEQDKVFYLKLIYDGDKLVKVKGPIFKEKTNAR